jgi:CheY-like chemotaxis protein
MKVVLKVLVVDDNRLNSRLVEIFLLRLGMQVQSVSSGAQALDCLAAHCFDLVILDLRMPEMSGEQVCRAIRDQAHLASLPVIAYTAHSMPEERGRMLATGFTGLMTKPISFADVKRVCADVLSGASEVEA